MVTVIFLKGFYGCVWVNMHTLSSPKVVLLELQAIAIEECALRISLFNAVI